MKRFNLSEKTIKRLSSLELQIKCAGVLNQKAEVEIDVTKDWYSRKENALFLQEAMGFSRSASTRKTDREAIFYKTLGFVNGKISLKKFKEIIEDGGILRIALLIASKGVPIYEESDYED